MQASQRNRLVTAGLVSALALVGCGSDSSGPPANTTITQQQANVLGGATATQIANTAAGLAGFGTGAIGQGFFAPSASPTARVLRFASLVGSPEQRAKFGLASDIEGCDPALSDAESTDTDGDGIFDDQTITFTAENCSGDNGHGAIETVTGSVRIQDTDDAETLFGFGLTFNDWTISGVSDLGTASASIDGSYSAHVGSATLGSDQALTLKYSDSQGTKVTYGQTWTGGFEPAEGQVIDPETGALPPGSFNFTGGFRWVGKYNGETTNFAFAISTVDPLVYDPACESSQYPFTSGQIVGGISATQGSVGFFVNFECGAAGDIGTFDNSTS